jgi:thiol:disulfide interchange protein DsbD
MRAAPIVALALLLSAIPLALPAPATAASAITWHDFDEGMNLSLNQRMPTMVDFSTSWCTWCKKMDAETFSDARVIDRSGSLVCIRVDGDNRTDLTAKYKVDGYPTTLFFNPDGSEKHRVVGYKGPDDFLKDIDFVLGQGPKPAESKGVCSFALLPLLLLPAAALLRRK